MTDSRSEPNQVSVDWMIEQLGYHPDLTKILRMKEAITIKLARGHLSMDEASAFLKDYLETAEQQLESCYSWFKVVDASKETIAQGILEAIVHQLAIPFTDQRARKILANFQKAYIWNEFVNWLIQKRDPYVPFNISILYRPAQTNHKVNQPIPVDYFMMDDANPESPSTNEAEQASVDEKSFSKDAVALMFVYLEKMGYFKATKARYRLRNEEAQKYHYSGDALYNAYLAYKKEINRITPKAIRHIEKAITLLKIHDGMCWSGAIRYAQADLTNIAQTYPAKA